MSVKRFLPIIPVVIIFLVGLAIFKGRIPPPEHILDWLTSFYKQYGYIAVFVSALLEGSFPVGLYVPGSTAILLGAALSKTGTLQFPIVIALATIGFVIAQSVNYFLGRFGFYHVLARLGLERGIVLAEHKLQHHRIKTLFLGYFHPGSASFLSTAAGVIKMPFWEFLLISFLSQLLWSLIWGTLAYIVGVPLVEFVVKYFTIVVIIGVSIWFGIRYWKRKRTICS